MTLASVIIGLLVGAISGWLLKKLCKTQKPLWLSIFLGLCGGVVGVNLVSIFGGSGMLAWLIASVIGALILILIVEFFA